MQRRPLSYACLKRKCLKQQGAAFEKKNAQPKLEPASLQTRHYGGTLNESSSAGLVRDVSAKFERMIKSNLFCKAAVVEDKRRL
jgi:hypothetical protein